MLFLYVNLYGELHFRYDWFGWLCGLNTVKPNKPTIKQSNPPKKAHPNTTKTHSKAPAH